MYQYIITPILNNSITNCKFYENHFSTYKENLYNDFLVGFTPFKTIILNISWNKPNPKGITNEAIKLINV